MISFNILRLLAKKRDEISSRANILRNGLWKIDDCKSKVTTMSIELEEAQVKVAEFQQQCDEYLVIIVAQKKEADEQQVNKIYKKIDSLRLLHTKNDNNST